MTQEIAWHQPPPHGLELVELALGFSEKCTVVEELLHEGRDHDCTTTVTVDLETKKD